MMDGEDHFLETFDRRLRGAAPQVEVDKLQEHARTCAACALQLKLSGVPERARNQLDERLDGRAIEAVLLRMRPGGLRRQRNVWVLAAAASLVAALAGARGLWLGREVESAASAGPVPLEATRPAPGSVRAITSAEHTPPPQVESTPEPRPVNANVSPGEPKPASTEETPADLFAQANQLRRRGMDEQALDAYRKLQLRFPRSPEARQSYATMGWLLLDRGRSSEALAQFDRYLSGRGPGSEDALGGRALSLQRLGRVAEERKALEALVQQFPKSAQAARAQLRLRELR